MTQIISNNNGGGGGGSYTPGTGIDISVDKEISIDTDVVQTVGNMVENLDDADNTHYPTAQAVKEAISASGGGDVTGPASSTDGNVVLFDGVTGKLIKDSGVNLSSKLDASAMSNNNYGGAWQGDSTHTPTKGVLYDKLHTMDVEIGNKAADTAVVKLTGNQTINGEKTFGTSPIVPSKSTDATNTGTAIATEAQVYNVQQDVDAIDDLIPTEATSSNKLADKNYVNDSINSVTAYYITKNAQGDQWATYAELAAATTFYSGGVARTPTRNDYTVVLADENHDNATTRYSYQGSQWEYQYTVNETALTQAQLDALNSGITSAKVSAYDGYASQISGKQDALTAQTAYTSQGTSTKVATISTNTLGQVTEITETNIDFPVTSVNGNTGDITGLATTSDLSGKQDKATSGSTAPSTTPSYVGEQYVDTTNDKLYVATGTSSSSDWMEVGAGGGFTPENAGNTGDKLEKTASGYQWVDGELVEIIPDMQGPAPSGFHVPLITEWQGLKTIMDGLGLTTGDNWRINLHMPFPGFRDFSTSNISSQGTYCYYWSASPYYGSDYINHAFYLWLNSSNVGASSKMVRAYGASLRCFKNSFVTPTSSWTVINGTLGSAGIFRDTVNGLISITSDGATGYTIQDKNLGATTVYNDGDTLAQANMGNMYQWGNNYGFPSTGSVTTSSTQVNASAYGPGNYYSSSTFITGNQDWSSVKNNNLRGGETGVLNSKYVGGERMNLVEITEGELDYSAMQGPAPSGFHVPLSTEWEGIKTIMDGLSLTTGDSWRINLHIPFAGIRSYSGASINFQNEYGYYWSSSPWGASYPDFAATFCIDATYVRAKYSYTRSNGVSIRPFKNSFITPTASWTVIQGTLGSAGIFRDTVNGLISITGDGTTGYTISDKNLGATTVYSDGDALSEANCGKYYQRGNNYGFPFTGGVTTSSTRVDASTYGPGNYYSSSTFISSNVDWSSVHNDNLRGGVTGIIKLNEVIAGNILVYKTIKVVLLSSGWSSNVQTVTATGVTATNNVIVSPDPSSFSDYTDATIYCSAQSTDSLTFTCDSEPSNDITVNVMIFS